MVKLNGEMKLNEMKKWRNVKPGSPACGLEHPSNAEPSKVDPAARLCRRSLNEHPWRKRASEELCGVKNISFQIPTICE